MSNPIVIAETLISTVARAFYSDTYVVLLEVLMHEKYIIEEELGPRLKLSAKEVRKITTQLESEMLLKVENVSIDDSKSFVKCFYIDYQQFVDAVRYRIHLMQKAIVSEEKTELSESFYQCPTCKAKYGALEAQRLLSADMKFICNNCCPANNFRTTISEAYYRLVEVDNTGKLSNLQLLEKKLEEQMNKSKLHDGIFDLLSQLRDTPLSHNLPSLNISKGVRSSKITDDRVAQEIKQNFEYATGQFGSSRVKPKSQEVIASGMHGTGKTEFNISIESEESNQNNTGGRIGVFSDYNKLYGAVGAEGAGRLGNHDVDDAQMLPHLRGTRVTGATEMLQSVKSLQRHRDVPGRDSATADSGDQPAAKKARTEEEGTSSADIAADATAVEDDDVDWEDADGDVDAAEGEDDQEEGAANGGEDVVAWEDGDAEEAAE